MKLEPIRAGSVETNIGASLVRFDAPDTRKATRGEIGHIYELEVRINDIDRLGITGII